MIGFWIAAALLAAGAAGLVLGRAARWRAQTVGPDPSIAVYRRALAEIEDLAGRELIAAAERNAARAEAARRLLGAADHTAPVAPHDRGRLTVIGAAALAPMLAAAIYLAVGAPGAPDQPFSARLAKWRAHPELFSAPELAAALRAVAAEHPRDVEPLRRLAGLDLSLGDADGATHALRRAMAIAPDRSDLTALLGEVLVLKANGAVSADARALFERTLRADPASPPARYYLARAAIAAGDRAGGLAQWRTLLAQLPANDPRRASLAADIETVARTGALPAPSDAAPVPTAEISGAIQGMVDGLAARLRDHPDDPAGWVRLVRAYTVLGETGRRAAALSEATRRYAARPDVLKALSAAQAAPR